MSPRSQEIINRKDREAETLRVKARWMSMRRFWPTDEYLPPICRALREMRQREAK